MNKTKRCHCKSCKEMNEYSRLLNAYVPKKHHKFFEDIYIRLLCVETDSAMSDYKIEKFIKAIGIEKAREILWKK
jgi:hypothetical protein